ncbi:MAG: tetratricopeptide repeat protein [Deltaproteobacteria bacterium]|nr:tetratricopeptide repeat protein [Deltaproteobacteria bacterium]
MRRKRILALFAMLSTLAAASASAQAPAGLINKAVEAYNAGDLARAALLFYEVRMTDTVAGNRAQAEYYLGQSLFKMGMYQSALAYFNAVFVAGPAHPYYLKGGEGLINVAKALRDDTLIPSQINKYYNSQEFAGMDPMALSRINFYVGLLLYRQEKYGESLAFLGAVDPKSSIYAKALFLQAIIHTRLGVRYNLAGQEAQTQQEYDQAIKLFEQILDLSGHTKSRATRALATYEDIQRLWQLCTLNLARSYYGKGDYAKAVVYYARIPRFSQDWADALFEIGWSFYMRQEYGKSLGALHTLHSPRFSDLFHPESWILKATIYFQVCLYDESKAALAYFKDHYESQLPDLKAIATDASLTNEQYASLLLRDQLEASDPMSKVPLMIRKAILANPRVENFRHFLRSLDKEAKAIADTSEWKGSRLAEELSGVVTVQRNLLEKTAGGFVKTNLIQTFQTIQGFVGHAKMIQLEIITRERGLLKANLSIKAEERGKLAPRPHVPDETWNYWPFRQEYWEDELGFFQYTVRRACPEGQQ